MQFTLGQYEEAINSYNQAIAIKPDDHKAFFYRGILQFTLGQYEEANESYNQAIAFKPDEHEAFYLRVVSQSNTGFDEEAINSYKKIIALKPDFHKIFYLKGILQYSLDKHEEAMESFNQANRCQQTSLYLLVQQGNFQKALEEVENNKNMWMIWLLTHSYKNIRQLTYSNIREILLTSSTAVIYWHQSSHVLTTFLLSPNHPQPIPIKTSLLALETWLNQWNENFSNYRLLTKNKQGNQEDFKPSHPWRETMPTSLNQLAQILNISQCLDHLSDFKKIILIPHRDLHLLPLEALFPEDIILSRLPSAQVAKNLTQTPPKNAQSKLLSIEDPDSTDEDNNPLPRLMWARIESEFISQDFNQKNRFREHQCTLEAITEKMRENPNIFHFTGHAYSDPERPLQSYIPLAGVEKLTVEKLLKLPLNNYHLVCLSGCGTSIIGNYSIITEYVGLSSVFMKQKATQIIGTLWSVEDKVSAILMIKYYQLRYDNIDDEISEAEALNQAIKWLKNLTPQTLSNWIESLLTKTKNQEILWLLDTELTDLQTYSRTEPEKRIYEHPYYWAAFTISGKQN